MLRIFIKFALYFLAIFIFLSTNWIIENFNLATTDQIFFQLLLIDNTIYTVPDAMVESYYDFIYNSLLFVVPCLFIEIIFYFLRKKYDSQTKYRLFKKIDKYIFSKISLGLFILSIIYFSYSFSFHDYIYGQFKKAALYKDYVDPKEVQIHPTKLKNLVLIYMESVEDTFSNTNIFGRDLLQNINSIPAVKFARYAQTIGTQWTIAGQFATQCGMPIDTNYVNYHNLCLTDILAKHGYYNIYIQGTSLDFTNKREFFEKHNIHKMYGKEEWSHQGVRVMNEWGVYDDTIFMEAKKLIKEMHDSSELFNLTILTGDTHFPGYISPSCRARGVNSMAGIVECSSQQVADLVQFIVENGYLENTNIVIIGDHLFHKDDIFHGMNKRERYVLNRFVSNDNYLPNREEILHVDMLPTILNFIGFKVENKRIGLGKSGFSE